MENEENRVRRFHTNPHNHRMQPSQCSGSTLEHNARQHAVRVHSLNTDLIHRIHMQKTQRILQQNVSRAPHTFSLYLTCWSESEPTGYVDRAHLFLWVWVWGFAVFWREVTILLNLKHLKYLRPPHPCSRLKEWPILLDLSECLHVPRSRLLTACHTGPNTPALDLIM